MSENNSKSASTSLPARNTLAEKSELFKNLASIRDRKYRLKTYKACFVGSEVVDALVVAGVVDTRKEAVKYGLELESQLRLFKQVNGGDSFADA